MKATPRFQPGMHFFPRGEEEMVLDSTTAQSRRTTPAHMRLRRESIQSLAQSGRLVRPGSSSSAGANGASGANGAGTDYDVGVDTVLQDAAAAAAAGGYPGPYEIDTMTPYSPEPSYSPAYEVDTMMVSGDIEEPKEGIMGWVQDNMLLSAAIAGTVGFFGYRYAKKQGMI